MCFRNIKLWSNLCKQLESLFYWSSTVLSHNECGNMCPMAFQHIFFNYHYLPWNTTNCWFPDFAWVLGGLAIEFHQLLPVRPAKFPSCRGKPCWLHAEVGVCFPSFFLPLIRSIIYLKWFKFKSIQGKFNIILDQHPWSPPKWLYPRCTKTIACKGLENTDDSSKTASKSVLEELSSSFFWCLYGAYAMWKVAYSEAYTTERPGNRPSFLTSFFAQPLLQCFENLGITTCV